MGRFLPRAALVVAAIGLTGCGSDRSDEPDAAVADAAVAGCDAGACDLGAPVAGARCADGMALVTYGDGGGVVCVDRFEAATVVVAPDGGTSPHAYDQPVDAIGNGLTIVAVVADHVKPQGYISAVQGAAACAAAGKRLCTLAEWLGACRGPSGFVYPYGDTYVAGACNEGRATNPRQRLLRRRQQRLHLRQHERVVL